MLLTCSWLSMLVAGGSCRTSDIMSAGWDGLTDTEGQETFLPARDEQTGDGGRGRGG